MDLARTDLSGRHHSFSGSSQSRSASESGEPAAAAFPRHVQLAPRMHIVIGADQDMQRNLGTNEEPPTPIRRFTVTVLTAATAGAGLGYGLSRLVHNPSIYFSGACTSGGFLLGALAGVVLYNRAPCLQDR